MKNFSWCTAVDIAARDDTPPRNIPTHDYIYDATPNMEYVKKHLCISSHRFAYPYTYSYCLLRRKIFIYIIFIYVSLIIKNAVK